MRWDSKTIWGGVVVALSQVLPLLGSGYFGPKAQAIGTAAGILLGAIGIRLSPANVAAEQQTAGAAPAQKAP